MFGIPEQHIKNLIRSNNDAVIYPFYSVNEECGELIAAISKLNANRVGHYEGVNSIVEEMTHVAISMATLATILGITTDNIKAEVLRKAESGNFDTANYIW